MTPVIATTHAIERYLERVDPGCTWEDAELELLSHERAVKAAASIGCKTVRLGSGVRLVLEGSKIVTVYAPDMRPRETRRGGPVGHSCKRDVMGTQHQRAEVQAVQTITRAKGN